MKKDIENRPDIIAMVNRFYEKIRTDHLLGPVFNDVAKVNWSAHLPVMYDFWENIIFHTGAYQGNPMNLHQRLHGITPLTENHFAQWSRLFAETVTELFEGKNAKLAIERSDSIAAIIKSKIIATRSDNQKIY